MPGQEKWLPVEGFSYEVSNLGRVRRVQDGKTGRRERVLRPAVRKSGRKTVLLHRNGEVHTRYVARLVCSAFHGPPEELGIENAEVYFLDGNRSNETLDNMVWCGRRERATEHARSGATRVTRQQVLEIRASYRAVTAGTTVAPKGWRKKVAQKYGVTEGWVSAVARGRVRTYG
ncbi:NUMOD4 domain-containing protein [Streptomyces sp. 5-10]|uniref:NUMOD4 domain-containing protein n=1 Tax=Streptomyces sp. 5-10 TaxID=878925 RepID=UPI00168AA3E4|nr:NUMOD4 domain-containing protein [Streptomyces sp. 5-10]MBD3004705.1 HNH endonuclease [Streptomyces sp. 5-10]